MVILFGLAVAGCSSAHVTTTASGLTGPLPAPAHVVLTDFAITPDEVKLDRGVGPSLMRVQNGQPPTQAQTEAAQATQVALAETLAAKLASYGLPVQRMAAGAALPPDSLLIQGQILSVDEGNRTRRTLLGLGAGKSSVEADTQLYYVTDPAQPRFLRSLSGTADSGRMPGAAETMGAGAVAGQAAAVSTALTAATHTGAEMRRTGDQANADRLAGELAREIGNYAVGQGWIAAAAVH
jgi:hypothetical protein